MNTLTETKILVIPDVVERAKEFAAYHHGLTNHLYDGEPYFTSHLQDVNDEFHRWKHLLPEENHSVAEAAGWVHDTIEDTRVTFNDVCHALGEEVAEIAYALTNEKGKTRKERANEKYYRGIQERPLAVFIKLCDRLANVRRGINKNGKMVEKYRQEQSTFKEYLLNHTFSEMFRELDVLLETTE